MDKINNLDAWRMERGLKIEELAERVGLSRTYTGRLLRGKRTPSSRTRWRIAKHTGLSPFDLFEEAER